MADSYYPKRNNKAIAVPEFFTQEELDPEMVSGLADKIITQTNAAEAERKAQEQNDLYHMKRLAEQAEGMSNEEALMMCKHFDETVLIEALNWHAKLNNKFKKAVIAASKEAIKEMET